MCNKQRISVSIERVLLKELEEESKKQNRSLSGQIEFEVRRYREGGQE